MIITTYVSLIVTDLLGAIMDKTTLNALVIGGSAVAGGYLGTLAGAKLGATYGLRAGPWGAVAGAVVGALACTALTSVMKGEDFSEDVEAEIS